MNLIACVDQNWGIGINGKLLLSIPEDMQYFKGKTINKTVVMGRNTFESLSNKKPLISRRNIVLSTKADYAYPNVEVFHTLDEFFKITSNIPTDDIYVIGGESIYRQLLPFCSKAYITKVDASYCSDKSMVNLDEDKAWELVREGQINQYNDIFYRFIEYESKPIYK